MDPYHIRNSLCPNQINGSRVRCSRVLQAPEHPGNSVLDREDHCVLRILDPYAGHRNAQPAPHNPKRFSRFLCTIQNHPDRWHKTTHVDMRPVSLPRRSTVNASSSGFSRLSSPNRFATLLRTLLLMRLKFPLQELARTVTYSTPNAVIVFSTLGG